MKTIYNVQFNREELRVLTTAIEDRINFMKEMRKQSILEYDSPKGRAMDAAMLKLDALYKKLKGLDPALFDEFEKVLEKFFADTKKAVTDEEKGKLTAEFSNKLDELFELD